MKIEIKNTEGKVIFSHDCEDNTIKLTVEEAVRAKVNLTGANLTWANLAGAKLTGANFTGANLIGADLTGADLTGAYLPWANGFQKK